MISRRCLGSALLCLAALLVLGASGRAGDQADEERRKARAAEQAKIVAEVRVAAEQDRRRFDAWRQSALGLAERLERGRYGEDRRRGTALRKALQAAGEKGVAATFDVQARLAGAADTFKDAERLRELLGRAAELEGALGALTRQAAKGLDDDFPRQRRAGEALLEHFDDFFGRQLEAFDAKQLRDGVARLQMRVEAAPLLEAGSGPFLGHLKQALKQAGEPKAALAALDEARAALAGFVRRAAAREEAAGRADLRRRLEALAATQAQIGDATAALAKASGAGGDQAARRAHALAAEDLAEKQSEAVSEVDGVRRLVEDLHRRAEEGAAEALDFRLLDKLREDVLASAQRLRRSELGQAARAQADVAAALKMALEKVPRPTSLLPPAAAEAVARARARLLVPVEAALGEAARQRDRLAEMRAALAGAPDGAARAVMAARAAEAGRRLGVEPAALRGALSALPGDLGGRADVGPAAAARVARELGAAVEPALQAGLTAQKALARLEAALAPEGTLDAARAAAQEAEEAVARLVAAFEAAHGSLTHEADRHALLSALRDLERGQATTFAALGRFKKLVDEALRDPE